MSDLPDSSNPAGYGQRCETCTVVRHADIGNQSINLNMQGALTTFGTSDTVGPSRGHPRLACMLGLILPQGFQSFVGNGKFLKILVNPGKGIFSGWPCIMVSTY